jgi:hypothetical protein
MLQPSVDFLLRLVLSIAIALLQAPRKFLALAFYNLKVVVGELAPLLLDLALELLPVSFGAWWARPWAAKTIST